MSKVILAIDQSITAAGWAYVTRDSVMDAGVFRPAKFDQDDRANVARLTSVVDFFRKKIRTRRPDLFVLEAYIAGSRQRRNGMTVVPELRGALKVLAGQLGIPYKEYHPQTYRRGLLGEGHGHAEKAEVASFVQRFFGGKITEKDYDMTDAVALGLFAAGVLENEATQTPPVPSGKRRGHKKSPSAGAASAD